MKETKDFFFQIIELSNWKKTNLFLSRNERDLNIFTKFFSEKLQK